MKQNIFLPTNIDYLKRQAKNIKKERNISHHEALNIVAHEIGFENWKAFINKSKLSIITESILPKNNPKKEFNNSDNPPIKKDSSTIDPYRNLLVGATNLLLEKKLISLNFKEAAQDSENGHIITELFNYPSVIIWRNIGFGELSISVWWKYNHYNHPQANLEGNHRENFRTTKPLADKRHYRKFVGVVASCWLERMSGKHLQGINRESIFDIYTRKGEKEELEKLPTQRPIGYKREGKFYI